VNILRIILIVGAGILMIYALSKMNYKNLSWTANKDYYPSLLSALCVMLAMVLSLF
jgi:hypothetical protein